MDNEITREQMIVPYKNENLMKSNLLIGAKYKASLNELRMTYAALYSIQNGDYREAVDGIYVKFSGSDIKRLLGSKGNGIYDTLNSIAQGMTSRSMGYSNPETNEFDYITLITRATYSGGEFEVKFNNDIKQYIVNLKGDFTNLNRLTMMSFKSAYTFRLYELLKKQCYYPKSYTGPRNNIFEIRFHIAELKFEMGVANAELESVKKILTGDNPDYEKALRKAEMSPDHISSYSQWYSFKKRCLDPAVKEISESDLSDIEATYTTEKSGQGGKVKSVVFIVSFKSNDKKDKSKSRKKEMVIPETEEIIDITLSESEKKEFHMKVLHIIDNEELTLKDVRKISEAAAYDIEKVKKAERIAASSGTNIKNYVGFLIKAIQDDYEEPVTVKGKNNTGKTKAANRFNNFEQREYDFDELEKQLMRAQQENR